ncbi:MAG: hypothetical protein M0Q44_20595, partial [Methylobacter sp.]|nr:hypothetical protein [Methylobacter sp.]
MLIGIKNLAADYGSIDMPGLFVMAVPTFSLATSVLLQTAVNNPGTKTALISFTKESGLFSTTPEMNQKLFDIYNAGNLLLNIVSIADGKHLFNKIMGEFEKKSFISVELVLIDISQDIFTRVADDELPTILLAWQSWFIRHNKTCVWVVHGGASASYLKNKFLKLNNLFNGLANIVSDGYGIRYEVVFWHLRSAIQTNVSLDISLHEANNEISVNESNGFIPDKKNTAISLEPGNRILVVKSERELQETLPPEWEVLNSLGELKGADTGNIATATIIIYINSRVDINLTANKIIGLRKDNGGWIKIILREMEPCIRAWEERLIIGSGANLIVPYGVAFLRFLSIVYALQGVYLIRNIQDGLEDISQVNPNGYGKNYLQLDDFVRQAISLAGSAQRMEIDASLIKLTLNSAIPVEEIAGLLKIKRTGDIFTFAKDYLY